MKFSITLLLTCLIFLTSNAQPGGGGGLKIMNVLDLQSKPILKKDTSLKIQHFILNEKNHKIKNLITKSELEKNSYHYSESAQTFYYLPPSIAVKSKQKNISCQRLMMIYQSDTMTIDFIDIPSENGAGYSDKMENIQFQAGYFKCYRNPRQSHKTLWQDGKLTEIQKREILTTLTQGIDAKTITYLRAIKLIEYTADPYQIVKMLKKQKENCEPIVVRNKYTQLCFNNLEIDDIDSSINIRTTLNPFEIDSHVNYHFLYYFQFEAFRSLKDKETYLAHTTLLKINTYSIKVNGIPISGQIKLAVFYKNVGISSKYSIYNITINQYQSGELIKTSTMHDVDLITEERLERPQ